MSITACIAVVRSSESVDAGALVRFVSISFCISMGCGSCNGREIAPGDVYTRLYADSSLVHQTPFERYTRCAIKTIPWAKFDTPTTALWTLMRFPECVCILKRKLISRFNEYYIRWCTSNEKVCSYFSLQLTKNGNILWFIKILYRIAHRLFLFGTLYNFFMHRWGSDLQSLRNYFDVATARTSGNKFAAVHTG